MQKNKLILLCKAPQRVGGLEVITPIVNEIRQHYNIKAYIFFSQKSLCYAQLLKDKKYKNIVYKVFDKKIQNYKFFKFILLKFILRHLFYKIKIIVFSNENMKNNLILNKKIKYLKYPSVTSLVRKERISENELNFFKGPLAIGIPKLYKSWYKLFNNEENVKDSLVIFLPSVLEGVFNFSEFKIWFSDICFSLKNNRKKILIKPHPMQKSDEIKYVRKELKKYKHLNWHETSSYSFIILAKASLVISAHSSVIIESLYFKIPTIFFQKFTDHWITRHPEKSPYLNIGATYVDSKKKLEKVLKIKNKKYNLNLDTKNKLLKTFKKNNIL